MSESEPEALTLYNRGVDAAQAGDEDTAVRLWNEGLDLAPPPGLEAMLRRNLVTAYFRPLKDIDPGSILSEPQATSFRAGERHLARLAQLVSGGSLGMDKGAVADLQSFVRFHAGTVGRMDRGDLLLPGDETGLRMFRLGNQLADAGKKAEALEILSRSLTHLDPENPELTENCKNALVRCAALANDLGQVQQSGEFAKEALSRFEFKEDDSRKLLLEINIQRAATTKEHQANPYQYSSSKAKELEKQASLLVARKHVLNQDVDDRLIARAFQQVLDVEPECTDPFVYAGLGSALVTLDPPRAKIHLQKAIECNARHRTFDDNPAMLHVVYKDLGLAIFQEGPGSYAEAVTYLRKALNYSDSESVAALISKIEASTTEAGHIKQNRESAASGGCFVATACEVGLPEMAVLRHFRDQILLRSQPGRWVVNIYNGVGPLAAVRVRNRPLVKWTIRVFLIQPLARVLRLAVQQNR